MMLVMIKTRYIFFKSRFRYGQYYFDDGTQAPNETIAIDQNPAYVTQAPGPDEMVVTDQNPDYIYSSL